MVRGWLHNRKISFSCMHNIDIKKAKFALVKRVVDTIRWLVTLIHDDFAYYVLPPCYRENAAKENDDVDELFFCSRLKERSGQPREVGNMTPAIVEPKFERPKVHASETVEMYACKPREVLLIFCYYLSIEYHQGKR